MFVPSESGLHHLRFYTGSFVRHSERQKKHRVQEISRNAAGLPAQLFNANQTFVRCRKGNGSSE